MDHRSAESIQVRHVVGTRRDHGKDGLRRIFARRGCLDERLIFREEGFRSLDSSYSGWPIRADPRFGIPQKTASFGT